MSEAILFNTPSPVFERLPEGYTELQSIASNGDSYISFPNIVWDEQDFDIVVSNVSYSQGRGLAGFGNYLYSLVCYNSTIRWCLTSSCYDSNVALSEKQHIEYGVGYMRVNGVNISSKSDSNGFTAGYSLFKARGINCPMTCYSHSISKKGIKQLDLVPCINPQNEVGMYDLVSQHFFGSETETPFIAGEPV